MTKGNRITVAVLAYTASLGVALLAMLKLLAITVASSNLGAPQSWEWYARNGAYVLGLIAIAILLFRYVKKILRKMD